MLEQIKEANDIKLIDPSEYRELAREIRRFLVRKVSRTGGHLASNLGVVELTMAMHLCCDLPEDKIVWDVGHQCYTHKILTGRQDAFDSLRQYGGIFQNVERVNVMRWIPGTVQHRSVLHWGLPKREIYRADIIRYLQ